MNIYDHPIIDGRESDPAGTADVHFFALTRCVFSLDGSCLHALAFETHLTPLVRDTDCEVVPVGTLARLARRDELRRRMEHQGETLHEVHE